MNEYYRKKLNEGLYYQDFVVEELYKAGLPIISYSSKEYQNMIGENKAGLEIKNDQLFRKTGNFYIEVAEKSDPKNREFIKSGIFRNDNTWLYIIGDFVGIYIFSKKQLQILFDKGKYIKKEIATSRGYLLPVKDAEKHYAIKTINITERA